MSECASKKIKTFHLPHQKGSKKDYWVAIFEGEIADGETREEALKKIMYKLKDVH